MKLYFIIATIEGREKLLFKLLESIKSIFTINNYEVIIVRQYNTKKLVIDKKNCTIFNINKYGASKARNFGLKFIKPKLKFDDYICFPDDDCYYENNFQKILIKNIKKSLDIIFGDVRDPNDELRMGAHVFNKTNLKLNFISINCPSFFIKYRLMTDTLFDENYGPGAPLFAVEETEMLYRISKNKKKINILYDPSLKIFHPYKIIEGQKLRNYSYAQGAFFRNIFNPFCIQFWIYLTVIIRPFIGYLRYFFDYRHRKYYLERCISITKGFLRNDV